MAVNACAALWFARKFGGLRAALALNRRGLLNLAASECPSISAAARLAPLRHINESRTSVMATKLIANATVAMASCSRIIAPQNGYRIEKRDPDLCLGRVGAPLPLRAGPPGIAVR